ncbi:MAG: tRNA-binding protein [Saprospiraceae bacterium]
MITYPDFQQVEMHVGTILEVLDFPNARQPAWQLRIDFGPEIGERRSSAQITKLYPAENLVGRQVIAALNFPVKQIANFFSEVLVLGLTQSDGSVVLLQPERPVENGLRVS